MKLHAMVAFAATLLLYACSATLNKSTNGTGYLSTDKSGKPMLLGANNRASLLQAPFSEWFDKNYNSYVVNDSISNQVKPMIEKKKVVVYLGTWCGDSKREVPRMLKILDAADVKKNQVKLVMLDNKDSMYKQSPGHEEKGLNIHRVPTFVIYENEKEIGRIVESPVASLEKDLVSILKKENYRPQYKAVVLMDSLFAVKQVFEIDKNIQETAALLKPVIKNAAELNTYGYVLMAAGKTDKAQLVFKMNLLLYPGNANLHDSLGEFYFKTGNFNLAKEQYGKVLELDPKNEQAKKMMEKFL